MPSPKALRFTGAQVRCRPDGGAKIRTSTRSASGQALQNLILGWAGGSPAGNELYGRDCFDQPGCWEWNLSFEAVKDLRHGLMAQIHEPRRFDSSAAQTARAKRLLAAIDACG